MENRIRSATVEELSAYNNNVTEIRKELAEEIKKRWKECYPASKDGKGIICPKCSHGANGDGVIAVPGKETVLKCFGSCGFSGDIIKLKMEAEGLNFYQAEEELGLELGLRLPDYETLESLNSDVEKVKLARSLSLKATDKATHTHTATATHTETTTETAIEEPIKKATVIDLTKEEGLIDIIERQEETLLEEMKQEEANQEETSLEDEVLKGVIPLPEGKLTSFYLQAEKNLEGCNYFQDRGLSLNTIKKHHLGVTDIYFTDIEKYTKAVIFPISLDAYTARNITESQDLQRYQVKGSKTRLYLTENFYSKGIEPTFIVEGELNALSMEEVGFKAVAIRSTSNYKNFLAQIKEKPPITPLILALDNDNPGIEAQEKIKEEADIEEAVYLINYDAEKLYNGCNDANELLTKDREALKQNLTIAVKECKQAIELEEVRKEEELAKQEEEERLKAEAEKEEYLKNSTLNYIDNFLGNITASANTPAYTTGFIGLDCLLEGGLYEGLYFIGALTSLGKTTLALQIMDNLAKTGEDVLIFSLEMARNELIAKSISRHTLEICLERRLDSSLAKTNRGITTGSRYGKYSPEEVLLINDAVKDYSQYANHIFIHEGVGDISVNEIRETIEKHIKITGNKPIVLVDYLQILAPVSEKATDKQNTDKAVLELKRISRDFKIPLIAISSLNRANYKAYEVSLEAFKESGAIEYTSDVLLGLQFKGASEKDFDKDRYREARSANPRELELVILKNRNGRIGRSLALEYYPMFNYFREII